MYTIGEISKIVKVSTDTLRYYDGIGLLKPGYIQKNSRYRYYSEKQIDDILFISELKQYGFSLEDIKKLLFCNNASELKSAFEERLLKLGIELSIIQKTMEVLKHRIMKFERGKEENMDNRTIMVVDDVALVRMLIKNIVEKFGFIVIGEAINGKDAIDKYQELKPELIIMDICMPIMDGIEAMLRIKEKDPEVKIIMCSGMSQAEIILECIKGGAKDFVAKPFYEQRLVEALGNAINEKLFYNNASITLLCNRLGLCKEQGFIFPELLNHEKTDRLLNLMNKNDYTNSEIDEFFEGISTIPNPNDSPDHHADLRNSNVDLSIMEAIFSYFDKYSSYVRAKVIEIFKAIVVCVDNSIHHETSFILNSNSFVWAVDYKIGSPPVTLFIPSDILKDKTVATLEYYFNAIKPLMNSESNYLVLSSKQYNDKYSPAFAQVYVGLEIMYADDSSFIMGISIPHELANSLEFKERLCS